MEFPAQAVLAPRLEPPRGGGGFLRGGVQHPAGDQGDLTIRRDVLEPGGPGGQRGLHHRIQHDARQPEDGAGALSSGGLSNTRLPASSRRMSPVGSPHQSPAMTPKPGR